MVGTILGHYRILEKLGAGGMGVVYRARDERLQRDVALKVLPPETLGDQTARARLLREARAAAALNHPYICTIHEVGEAGGQVYIAMEYVKGVALSALVPAGGMPPDRVVGYGLQLAEAMAHAHEHGIVHRDLKTTNVVVTPEHRTKVLDFGLAKRVAGGDVSDATTESHALLTQPGTLAGTLAYMAPEQLRGQPADARSDVWALGVVLYEMATGQRPFQGQTGFELSSAILSRPVPPAPGKVPVALRAIIERCLEKEPARRYQQAGEVRAVLEAIEPGRSPVSARLRYLLRLRRRTAPALAAAALALLLGWFDAGGVRTRWLGGPRIDSLAVLPLENLSGDPEQDYFAEGIHDALITDLAKLSALRKVIARSSVLRYRQTDKPLSQIARELGVDAIMTGSVVREGDRVRITAQLIRAGTEEPLWAERYERELRRVLSLQNEIVAAITRETRLKLTPQEQMRLESARPIDPRAHEAYLLGRYHWNRRTNESLHRSLEYFERAIALDPDHALAYAGMADTYNILGVQAGQSAHAVRPRAKEAALRALELDPSLAEAHTALAMFKLQYEWDWTGAEAAFRQAIQLNPNYALARLWHLLYLASVAGRADDAIEEALRARELDPLSLTAVNGLARTFYLLHRYSEAIEESRKALDMDPGFALALYDAGRSYIQQGNFAEGISAFEKMLAADGSSSLALGGLGHAYAVAGMKEEAAKVLSRMVELSRQRYVSPYDLSLVCTGLGDREQALMWLEEAYETRVSWLIHLKVDPRLDPLRSDERFQDLLRRMNFPQ